VKYMLLYARDDEEFLGSPEEATRYEQLGGWFQELAEQGKLGDGFELQPARSATTVRWKGDEPVVTDGPFMESKETIAGYSIIEAADLDEAIAIAKKWPLHTHSVEIRPVIEQHEH
jgi:hypothetical protein